MCWPATQGGVTLGQGPFLQAGSVLSPIAPHLPCSQTLAWPQLPLHFPPHAGPSRSQHLASTLRMPLPGSSGPPPHQTDPPHHQTDPPPPSDRPTPTRPGSFPALSSGNLELPPLQAWRPATHLAPHGLELAKTHQLGGPGCAGVMAGRSGSAGCHD
jgi:hypothetical protein